MVACAEIDIHRLVTAAEQRDERGFGRKAIALVIETAKLLVRRSAT